MEDFGWYGRVGRDVFVGVVLDGCCDRCKSKTWLTLTWLISVSSSACAFFSWRWYIPIIDAMCIMCGIATIEKAMDNALEQTHPTAVYR